MIVAVYGNEKGHTLVHENYYGPGRHFVINGDWELKPIDEEHSEVVATGKVMNVRRLGFVEFKVTFPGHGRGILFSEDVTDALDRFNHGDRIQKHTCKECGAISHRKESV